ncbi:hypothetical protein LG325_01270 [Marinobacter nauticus]
MAIEFSSCWLWRVIQAVVILPWLGVNFIGWFLLWVAGCRAGRSFSSEKTTRFAQTFFLQKKTYQPYSRKTFE